MTVGAFRFRNIFLKGDMMRYYKMVMVTVLAFICLHAEETIDDMPGVYKSSIEWVWNNRLVPRSASAPIGEGSVVRENLIFDQIWSHDGRLSFCGRWQSTRPLTLDERKKLENILSEKINAWAGHLVGFDGWPFGEIEVKIVSWAVLDASVIVDRQPDEIVYTTTEHDPVSDQDSRVPSNVPVAPDACSRFEHFTDSRYTYESCPDGPKNRFDMYLWATSSWMGAVGGDWGQRMSENSWLSGSMMINHEMGHGFGITDFYQEQERPQDMNNGTVKSIMWAGNAASITEWDKWLLRYVWTQLKADTDRFPPRETVVMRSGFGSPGLNSEKTSKKFTVAIRKNAVLISSLTGESRNRRIHVTMVDVKGREAFSVSRTAADRPLLLRTGSLENGCYFLRIQRNGYVENHRINIVTR